MNRRVIVTGAYGAIGKAIAQRLTEHGLSVTLVGRNETKLQQAVSEIRKRHPEAGPDFAVVDLSRETSIKEFSETWQGPLHILINNAASSPRMRTESPEGIEIQWATNVLGYHWMIRYFLPYLKKEPGARIVNVASYWAGGLNFDDPEFRNREYDNDEAYRQSKQADRMISAYWAEKLKPDGITVNACHPGDVNSKLSNDLGFGGTETPRQGADTPVWLAVSQEVTGETGRYYEHRTKCNCPFMQDQVGISKLLGICRDFQ